MRVEPHYELAPRQGHTKVEGGRLRAIGIVNEVKPPVNRSKFDHYFSGTIGGHSIEYEHLDFGALRQLESRNGLEAGTDEVPFVVARD